MLTLGLAFAAVTLLVMFSGMPIAFALGTVATGFMYFFRPAASLDTITQNVYEEMASITLLSIPLFILKGAAIGRSDAGRAGGRVDRRTRTPPRASGTGDRTAGIGDCGDDPLVGHRPGERGPPASRGPVG